MASHLALGVEIIDLSFVIIGFNEAPTIQECLESCRRAELDGLRCEFIYVDGGSSDDSIARAKGAGAEQIIASEGPRRAAGNRNAGLNIARGEFVQFLDGDMAMDPGWPLAAIEVLRGDASVAAVFGRLQEANEGALYRALQLDWQYPEGPALYVGGAAMFRRAPLVELGGFPEDVRYGEEPYLCWRLRNEMALRVWHLHRTMARHDLAYAGFGDYWRRNVRVGETYAEIAARCWGTDDPFWKREVLVNLAWVEALVALAVLLVFAPSAIRIGALIVVAVLLARKVVQTLRRGQSFPVSLLFAGHTYLSKLSIGSGIVKWYLFGRRRAQ